MGYDGELSGEEEIDLGDGCSTCGARPGEGCIPTAEDLRPPDADADELEWDIYLSWFEDDEDEDEDDEERPRPKERP